MPSVSTIYWILISGVPLVWSSDDFKCPPEWKSRSASEGTNCYFYGTEPLGTFKEAQTFCHSKSGKLIWMYGETENRWIRDNRPPGIGDPYWLGYIRIDKIDYWNDKSHPINPKDFHNWEEVGVGDGDHGIVDPSGKWHKVGERYGPRARALCKMTEDERSVGSSFTLGGGTFGIGLLTLVMGLVGSSFG